MSGYNDNIEKSKDFYNSIDIPVEIDLVIEKAIKRGKRHKNRKIMRPAIAAAFIAAFIASINISPAFAGYLCKVPGLESLVKLVMFDKGLKLAVDNGFVQEINKSATDKGITFTIDNIILDRKKIIIEYTTESQQSIKDLHIGNFKVTDTDGKDLEVFISYGFAPENGDPPSNKKVGLITIQKPDDSLFPDNLIFVCKSFNTGIGSDESSIAGNWAIDISLDRKLASVEPESYTPNAQVSIDNMKFFVDDLKIYPTVVDALYRIDGNNPYRFCGFKNLRLEDENGNSYSYNGSYGKDLEKSGTFTFESSYFINAKELYIEGDGIYCMPKEDKYLIVDLDNKRVIDDGGYKIEYLYDSKDPGYASRENEFEVMFNIRDEEILKENDGHNYGGIQLSDLAYDENGKPFQLAGIISGDGNHFIHTGFYIDTSKGIPHKLKIKITGVTKGIIKPFKVRVK